MPSNHACCTSMHIYEPTMVQNVESISPCSKDYSKPQGKNLTRRVPAVADLHQHQHIRRKPFSRGPDPEPQPLHKAPVRNGQYFPSEIPSPPSLIPVATLTAF